MLDGLDEVPAAEVGPVIRHINDFVDKYGGNRFITSCRTAFYRNSGWLPHFQDVVLEEFQDNQIENFIRNWFRCGPAGRESLAQ